MKASLVAYAPTASVPAATETGVPSTGQAKPCSAKNFASVSSFTQQKQPILGDFVAPCTSRHASTAAAKPDSGSCTAA